MSKGTILKKYTAGELLFLPAGELIDIILKLQEEL